MAEEKFRRFIELFGELRGAQVFKLGVEVTGQLGQPVETAVQVNLRPQIGRNQEGKTTLVLNLQIDMKGKSQQAEIFTATSSLSGAWQATREIAEGDHAELSKIAVEIAVPQLYPVVRQNLVDVLAKAGIHADAFPWQTLPANVQSVENLSIERSPPQKRSKKQGPAKATKPK